MKEDSRRSGSGGGIVGGMRGVVGLIQQYKADPSEVQVLREAGWVSGPGGEAVGAGGGVRGSQLTLPGSSPSEGGWDV